MPEAIARFQLRLPFSLLENLKEIAKAEDRSTSNLMRRMLEDACTKAGEQISKPLEDRKNA